MRRARIRKKMGSPKKKKAKRLRSNETALDKMNGVDINLKSKCCYGWVYLLGAVDKRYLCLNCENLCDVEEVGDY